MKRFIFLFLFFAPFSGCLVPAEGPEVLPINESLIDVYYLATPANPIRISEYGSMGVEDHRLLYININGAEKAPLLEMRQRYDDTHFNSYIHQPGRYAVFANDFTSVDLVSDADFNDIEAGQSLGGVVRLHALSPYRWLSSGSKVTFDWEHFFDDSFWPDRGVLPIGQLYPVNAFLKDLTPDDLKLLLLNYTLLYFCELPAIKTHTLTLTFYEKDTTISSSTRVVFQ